MDPEMPDALFDLDENQGVGVNNAGSTEMGLEDQIWSCHEMVRFVIVGCDQPVWLNSMTQAQSFEASEEALAFQDLHLQMHFEF